MANWVHYGGIGAGYAPGEFFPKTKSKKRMEKIFSLLRTYYHIGQQTLAKISLSRLSKNIDKDPALILHQKNAM